MKNPKKDLDLLINQFDTFEINVKKFEDVKQGVSIINKEFHAIIEDYNSSLEGNKKHSFRFKEIEVWICL